MTDTLSISGYMDEMRDGYVVVEDLPYVLTVSGNYLVNGWPEWSYRYTSPLDDEFTETLGSLRSGSADIYNGNPQAFLVPAGAFDLGNHGVLRELITDFLGVFDDFAVFGALGQDPSVDGWMHPASPNNVNVPVGSTLTPPATASLTAALSMAGPISSLTVSPLSAAVISGQTILVSYGNNHTQAFTSSGAADAGATTLPVVSAFPNYNYPVGASVLCTVWQESTALIFPPKDARYVVPVVNMDVVNTNQSVNLDAFDLRVVPFNEDPALKPVWQSPRSLVVKVKPTRLNYSTSPDFTKNIITSNMTITPSTQHAFYGTRSGEVTIPANGPAWNIEKNQVEVTPGEDLWVTWQYYAESDLAGTYRIRVDFFTEDQIFVSTVRSTDAAHLQTNGQWQEVTLMTPVPARATKAAVFRLEDQEGAATTDVFWVDASLIERSSLQQPFFCGDFPGGSDYLWRDGDVEGATWSYYYQDREARNYILTRLLQKNLPLGMKVGEPQYAAVGDPDMEPPLNGYGSGSYGAGMYGGDGSTQGNNNP